jgi:hypothetical protein
MLRAVCTIVFFIASSLFAQNCTTYAVVDPFNGKTNRGIDNLKAEDFEAKAGGHTVPIVSATQNLNNRVLVLLQLSNSAEKQDMQNEARKIGDLVRYAPAGRAIAFGVFSEKAVISSDFSTDPQKRAAALDDVVARAAQLAGKTSALYDSLHGGIAAFGAHQPGDTILLMSDGKDITSKRNPGDLEKEFLANGVRLLVVIEAIPMMGPKTTLAGTRFALPTPALKSLSSRTGGAYRYFETGALLDFAWAGYMLGLQIPATWDKPKEWQLQVKDSNGKIDKTALVYAPAKLASCGNTASAAAH